MAYYGKGVQQYTFNSEGREYYYIHRHVSHFKMDEAVELFSSQKKQNYLIMKNRYQKNFLENIQMDRKFLELLDASMSEEEKVSMLDQTMLEVLDKQVSEQINSYKLDSRITNTFKSLDNFLKSGDIRALDKVFQQITAATKFLQTDIQPLSALIGMQGEYKKHRDLHQLDIQLLQAIKDTFEDGSGKIKLLTTNQARLKSVMQSVQKFVHELSGLGTTSGNIINKNSLQRYLTNIFSTQIGEFIVSSSTATAMGQGLKDIRKSLTGGKRVQFTEDEKLNQFIRDYGNKSRTFKTDNSFSDLAIDVNFNSQNIRTTVNLGLSTKWYKNSGVNLSDSVSIGGETSFTYRLNQMFQKDKDKYLTYNALALAEQDNSGYSALKAALIARNADAFISGLGMQGDFSQYIVVNGKFYSIWQILTLLENYNKGEGSTQKETGTDPVTISITKLNAVLEISRERLRDKNPDLTKAYAKIKQQNNLIEVLGITGHFYPERFKNLT